MYLSKVHIYVYRQDTIDPAQSRWVYSDTIWWEVYLTRFVGKIPGEGDTWKAILI